MIQIAIDEPRRLDEIVLEIVELPPNFIAEKIKALKPLPLLILQVVTLIIRLQCLQLHLHLLGFGNTLEVKEGIRSLRNLDVDLEKGKFYTYYYVTQAMFHEGKSSWARWNHMFASKFVKHQSANGSFVDAAHHNFDPEYSTSLAALTLMVFYRNLPTFQERAVTEKVEQLDDDVKIEII